MEGAFRRRKPISRHIRGLSALTLASERKSRCPSVVAEYFCSVERVLPKILADK